MLLLSFGLLTPVSAALGPTPRTLVVSPRVLPAIVLDGVISSGEWGVPVFTDTQTNPGPVEYNVYVESDDENLYIASEYVSGDFSVAQGLGLATALNVYIDANPPTLFDGVVDDGDLAVMASNDEIFIPYVPGANDWDWQGSGSFSAAGGALAVDGDYTTGSGIVEVKIPFSMIGALPGDTIGLLFQAFGYDSLPWMEDVHPNWPETYAPLTLLPFSSIQTAVDAANPGDTIYVMDGEYAEAVAVDEEVTIEAESLGAIVDGGFWLQVDNIVIDGFTVLNGFLRPGGSYKYAFFTDTTTGPLYATSGHSIVNNDLQGDYTGVKTIAIGDGPDGSNDLTIAGNLIHGWKIGIMLSGVSSGHQILGNDIYENLKTGVELSKISDTTIEFNTIRSNAIHGVNFMDAGIYGGGNVVHYNNFCSNGIGLENNSGNAILDAINNYWCHPSGPSHSPGYGDKVSDFVLYDPWLLKPVVSGEDPVTYDKTLTLQDGWTLVSTDDWVDPENTVGEGVVLAYGYTPGLGYQELTPADLVPVDALFVKTIGGGGIGIAYLGGAPVASSKELAAGWNLISSATETQDARSILSPIRFVQVGEEQGVALATFVSQGDYNLHSESFYMATLNAFDWMALMDTPLNPFDGYWANMNAPKEFGVIPGVTVAPVTPHIPN